MPTTAAPEATLSITPAALARVRELLAEQGDPVLKLRVSVDGGGCSGFQYGFGFEAARADDTVVTREGVDVLIDPQSLPFLEGAEVDYVEQLAGAHFVVHNPNARSTCGCGSSFTA